MPKTDSPKEQKPKAVVTEEALDVKEAVEKVEEILEESAVKKEAEEVKEPEEKKEPEKKEQPKKETVKKEVEKPEEVVAVESKNKAAMCKVIFVKKHRMNVGGFEVVEYKKGDRAEMERHLGIKLMNRGIVTVI